MILTGVLCEIKALKHLLWPTGCRWESSGAGKGRAGTQYKDTKMELIERSGVLRNPGGHEETVIPEWELTLRAVIIVRGVSRHNDNEKENRTRAVGVY